MAWVKQSEKPLDGFELLARYLAAAYIAWCAGISPQTAYKDLKDTPMGDQWLKLAHDLFTDDRGLIDLWNKRSDGT